MKGGMTVTLYKIPHLRWSREGKPLRKTVSAGNSMVRAQTHIQTHMVMGTHIHTNSYSPHLSIYHTHINRTGREGIW